MSKSCKFCQKKLDQTNWAMEVKILRPSAQFPVEWFLKVCPSCADKLVNKIQEAVSGNL